MNLFFICDQDEVKAKLQTLIQTETADDGVTKHYLDKLTNEKWILTYYDSEFSRIDVPMLKRLPELTIDQLIDIAMTSLERNDIIGASLELLRRENLHKEEFRDKLIERLVLLDTSKLNEFEKQRLHIIVYESHLCDSTNRKDIVGKHFTEIESDASYYRTIAQRAMCILNDIDKYGG